MTMIEEKTSHLISTLIEKTKQNKVVWKKTLSDNYYRAPFSEDYVLIRKGPGRRAENRDSYSLSLRNAQGLTVEVIRQSPGDKEHNKLEQMFNEAKQSADRYIEQSLDNLLEELKSI